MPRIQQILHKYKCLEPGCQRIIRQDKWPTHCKTEHGFKVKGFLVFRHFEVQFVRHFVVVWLVQLSFILVLCNSTKLVGHTGSEYSR